MSYPDKRTHKPTITNKLRQDLIKFSKGFEKACYLEIGFDRGFTMAEMSPYYVSMYGIDNNPDRFAEAKGLFEDNEISNATLLCGDSSRIPMNRYDVVLIDAAHEYENLLVDTLNVLKKNINDNPFLIVYHDFGLVHAGVRKFCEENFTEYNGKNVMVPVGEKSGWNPLGGPVDGPEAVACAFNNEMKKHYIEILEEKLK